MRLSGTRVTAIASGKGFGNQLWDLAGTIPTLDLRLAENKSLVDATTGQQLVTFTRASSGTYVGSDGLIKTAATNEARFDHNPTTGESLGLLVEEQRANLLLYSACDSNWPSGGFGTATYNLGLSALGVFSGVQVASSGQNWHSIYRTGINLTASTVYAFTLFYRAGTSGRVRLTFRNNGTVTETVVNGLAGNLSVSAQFAGSAAILSQYLCSDGLTYVVTGTYTPNGTNVDHWLRIGPDSTVSGQTVIALGAQLEAGAFPTSYIPTTTATVTRSADVASITGANFSSWYRQDEGTLFTDTVNREAYTGSNVFPCILQIDDGTNNNRISYDNSVLGSGYRYNLPCHSGGVSQGELNQFGFASGAARWASAFRTNDFALAINLSPSVVSTRTSGTLPNAMTQLRIGSGFGKQFTGTIRRLTYWPTRLGNEVLQTITQ
jgi:hypothetical protein